MRLRDYYYPHSHKYVGADLWNYSRVDNDIGLLIISQLMSSTLDIQEKARDVPEAQDWVIFEIREDLRSSWHLML